MPHQCTACGHAFEDGSKEMLSGCPDCGGNKFQFRPASEGFPETTGDADESSERPDSSSDIPDDQPMADSSSVAETVGRATTKVRDIVSSDPVPPSADPDSDAEWPGRWEGTADASGGGDSSSSAGDDDIIDADARSRARSGNETENTAQASARTDVVAPSEIDAGGAASNTDGPTATPSDTAADGTSTDSTMDSATAAESDPSTDDAAKNGAPDAPSDGEVVGEPTGDEPDLTELREQLNEQFESIKILEPGQYELNLMELYDREEYIIALQENGRYVIQVPEQWIGDDLDDR